MTETTETVIARLETWVEIVDADGGVGLIRSSTVHRALAHLRAQQQEIERLSYLDGRLNKAGREAADRAHVAETEATRLRGEVERLTAEQSEMLSVCYAKVYTEGQRAVAERQPVTDLRPWMRHLLAPHSALLARRPRHQSHCDFAGMTVQQVDEIEWTEGRHHNCQCGLDAALLTMGGERDGK